MDNRLLPHVAAESDPTPDEIGRELDVEIAMNQGGHMAVICGDERDEDEALDARGAVTLSERLDAFGAALKAHNDALLALASDLRRVSYHSV